MKGFIKLVVGFIFAFMIVQFSSKCLVEYSADKMNKNEKTGNVDTKNKYSSTSSSLNALATLKRNAEEMNKTLPMILDSELTLDSVVVTDNTLLYRVKYINYPSHELDGNAIYERAYKAQLVAHCTNPDMQFLIDNGITMRRDYYANNGILVTQVIIKPSDCLKLAACQYKHANDKSPSQLTAMGPAQALLVTESKTPNNANNSNKNEQERILKDTQSLLKFRGYYNGNPDGKYGPRTKSAVIAYQNDHNLSADGIVSAELLAHIKNSSGGK